MADNSINHGRLRTYQPRNERLDSPESRQPQKGGDQEKPQLSEKIRRAVGIRIGTLRAHRPRTPKHGLKVEPPKVVSPPPEKSRDRSVSTSVNRSGTGPEHSVGIGQGYRSDIVLPETLSDPLPLAYQKLEYYKNYKITEDPQYQTRKESPNLVDPDIHPDRANLDLEKRASMAYLVQYGGIFANDPKKYALVEKIIDSGSTSAALRFLVYHTTTFDQDTRMNRYFEQYVDERKEHRGHLENFVARSPEYYKSVKEFYHTEYDVFRRRN